MKNLILLLTMILSLTAFGQDNKTTTTVPIPAAVEFAFQNQFPNTIAEWSTTYEGEANDQRIYVGKFEINTVTNNAMYDIEGQFYALQTSLISNEVPATIRKYMKKNYPKNPINIASKTIDKTSKLIYEVGISRDGTFYDFVFDSNGNFIQMIQKD